MSNQKIKDYTSVFYDIVSAKALASAKVLLPECLKVLPEIHSVIDFGCGQGAWLSVFQELGITEIQGLDGKWIDQNALKIPKNNFSVIDFENEIVVGKKYDLAVSLEVAEHITKDKASVFVDSLTKAADFVLFSAAIPFQGGTKHVNEQWPEYWSRLFEEKGYVAQDSLRAKIWNESSTAWFYKQNVILYVKKNRLADLRQPAVRQTAPSHASPAAHGNVHPLPYVHPELFLRHMGTNIHHIPILQGFWILSKRIIKAILKIGKPATANCCKS